MRGTHPDRIGLRIAPAPRFAAGMLMLPPYLLIEGLPYKAGLAAFFALLAVLAGKRLRWGYFLLLITSVTFFHLLAPWGRVLLEVGSFTVTTGALENGLTRGITLVGMVFLSVAAVRPELELPGRLGGLVGRTFYHFDSILEGKKRLTGKNFFTSLDELLMERFNPEAFPADLTAAAVEIPDTVEKADTFKAESAGSRRGRLPAIGVVLIPWFLWAWTLLAGK